MSVLPDALRVRIVSRHHTVTRAELAEAGVPPDDIARWRACGIIVDVAPGMFAIGDAMHHRPFLTRAAAMSLADDDAVCDPLTSAAVWGLGGVFSPSRPAVVAATGVPSSHIVERPDGIRAMSPAATWLGVACELRPAHFERWSVSIIPDRVSLRAAHDAVRRSADHRRRPHLRAIRLLSTTRSWQRPHWSDHERRVRASLRRRGLNGLDGTHSIELPSGIVLHPTAVDHGQRWAVELDHRRWHGGRWSAATQRWVDHQLEQMGWTYVRVTDRKLDRDPHRAMQIVTASHPSRVAAA